MQRPGSAWFVGLSLAPFLFACGSSSKNSSAPMTEAETSVENETEEEQEDYDPKTLVSYELFGPGLAPGEQGYVGARFSVKPGWHIYWINPGDSGLPTSIKFEKADGLAVDGPVFPGPVRFGADSEVVNFGYKGDVIVPIAVAASPEFTGATLSTKASWLACRDDACVPGDGQAELAIKRLEAPESESQVLAPIRTELPMPIDKLESHGIKMQLTPQGPGRVEVQLDGPTGTTMELFPVVDASVESAVTESDDRGSSMHFTLVAPKANAAQSTDTPLVVLAVTIDSHRRYFSVPSDVVAQ